MSSPNRDGWDWPYLIYIGRVWLCYTDEEFWRLTPRQLKTQIDVHEDITRQMYGSGGSSGSGNGRQMSRQPLGFIDQIKGW